MKRNREINMRGKRAVIKHFFKGSASKTDTSDQEIERILEHNDIDVRTSEKKDRGFFWIINLRSFLIIDQKGDHQFIRGGRIDGIRTTQYFVHFHEDGGEEYFKVPKSDLQCILEREFQKRLDRHNNVRPVNPKANTFPLRPWMIEQYRVGERKQSQYVISIK